MQSNTFLQNKKIYLAYNDFRFIKECFYQRYEIKFFPKNLSRKEVLAKENFLAYPLSREVIYYLNAFPTWPLLEQLEFRGKIFIT